MVLLDFDHPHIDHPALRAFAKLAGAYCELVEKHASLDPRLFAEHVHVLLADLYAAGLRLPTTGVLFNPDADDEIDDDAPYESPPPDPDDLGIEGRNALHKTLTEYFDEGNYYREVFDPWEPVEGNPEVLGGLGDDVADTYSDLKRGLLKWFRGETGGALWEWRFGLENHWGEHATGAIRALHTRAAWWDGPWPAAPSEEPGRG